MKNSHQPNPIKNRHQDETSNHRKLNAVPSWLRSRLQSAIKAGRLPRPSDANANGSQLLQHLWVNRPDLHYLFDHHGVERGPDGTAIMVCDLYQRIDNPKLRADAVALSKLFRCRVELSDDSRWKTTRGTIKLTLLP